MMPLAEFDGCCLEPKNLKKETTRESLQAFSKLEIEIVHFCTNTSPFAQSYGSYPPKKKREIP